MSELASVKPFFQLVIGDGNSIEVDNATVPVRWCLNESMARLILECYAAEYNIEDLYIALSVCHPRTNSYDTDVEYQDLSRTVAPLKDGMAYVTINRPGKFVVYASILLPRNDKALKSGLKRLHRRTKRGYMDESISNFSLSPEKDTLEGFAERCRYNCQIVANFVGINDYINRGICQDSVYSTANVQFAIDGTCPPELFSSITPNWFTDWVNYGYETSVVDQCSFRRRLIVWALIKSWGLPVIYIVVVSIAFAIGLFALFFGYKLINFKNLIMLDDDDANGDGIVNTLKWGDSVYIKHPVACIVHPFSWPLWYMTYQAFADGAVMQLLSRIWQFFAGLQWSMVSVGLFLGAGVMLYSTYKFIDSTIRAFVYPSTPTKLWRSIPAKLYGWLDRREAERRERMIKNMSCGGDPMKFATAPKPRSVKLVASKIKSKVCKPMSL